MRGSGALLLPLCWERGCLLLWAGTAVSLSPSEVWCYPSSILWSGAILLPRWGSWCLRLLLFLGGPSLRLSGGGFPLPPHFWVVVLSHFYPFRECGVFFSAPSHVPLCFSCIHFLFGVICFFLSLSLLFTFISAAMLMFFCFPCISFLLPQNVVVVPCCLSFSHLHNNSKSCFFVLFIFPFSGCCCGYCYFHCYFYFSSSTLG